VIDAAVAGNEALVEPAGTRTDAATVRLGLLLLRVTEAPPDGADEFSVTVQFELPGAATVAGLHVTPLGCMTGQVVALAAFE